MIVATQQPSTSSFKLSMAAGGFTLAAGLAYLYYKNSKNDSNTESEMSREFVTKVLKEFKKEFYGVYKHLSLNSLQMQSHLKNNFRLPPDQIKEAIRNEMYTFFPKLKSDITEIEDKVYLKHNIINRSDFEKLCKKLAKIDPVIAGLMKEIHDTFQGALFGNFQTPQINLPMTFSSEKVLEVYKESIKKIILSLSLYVQKYIDENGALDRNDENFHIGLSSLNIERIRYDYIVEEGFDMFQEYHPSQVFSYYMVKYTNDEASFKDKVGKLDKLNQEMMGRMFMSDPDFVSFNQDLNKFDEILKPVLIPITVKADAGLDLGDKPDSEVVNAQGTEEVQAEVVEVETVEKETQENEQDKPKNEQNDVAEEAVVDANTNANDSEVKAEVLEETPAEVNQTEVVNEEVVNKEEAEVVEVVEQEVQAPVGEKTEDVLDLCESQF